MKVSRDSMNSATLENYQVYLDGLKQHWNQYASIFNVRILRVLEPGPTFMPHEDKLAVMGGYSQRPDD